MACCSLSLLGRPSMEWADLRRPGLSLLGEPVEPGDELAHGSDMALHELSRLDRDHVIGVEILHVGESPSTLRLVLARPPEADGLGPETPDVAEVDAVGRDCFAALGAVHAVLVAAGILEVHLECPQHREYWRVLPVVRVFEGRDDIAKPPVMPLGHEIEELHDCVERFGRKRSETRLELAELGHDGCQLFRRVAENRPDAFSDLQFHLLLLSGE